MIDAKNTWIYGMPARGTCWRLYGLMLAPVLLCAINTKSVPCPRIAITGNTVN